ncbi:MAG: Asp-tRNA(Asn)/Glu-tRNA(Gln) amidotransferase subunit GatC [Proteobacteria bacterium]|nr:Asp-tRNA(Asn)/Glu-tRNA(Gln) amidotransferase subunit GatC [Pseudomonadota bacterium]
MSIDKNTVKKVAGLARLRLADAEMEKYAGQLNNIMGFVEQLNEVNTDNVEPLPSPVDMPLPLRRDAVTDGGDPDTVLSNAPEAVEGFYVVPKVVE